VHKPVNDKSSHECSFGREFVDDWKAYSGSSPTIRSASAARCPLEAARRFRPFQWVRF